MTVETKIEEQLKKVEREYLRGNYPGAREYLKKLISQENQQPEIIKWKLRLNLAEDKVREGERNLKKLEKVAPSDPETYILGAHLHWSKDRFAVAKEYAQKALQLSQSDEHLTESALLLAESLLGLASQKLTKLAEKKKSLQFSSLPPKIESSLKEGLQHLKKIENTAKDRGDYWEILATYYQLLGRGEEEASAWEQAVEIEPENPDYLHNLALSLLQREKLSEAEKLFQKIYRLERDIFRGEKLIFSPKTFEKILQNAWSEVRFNLFEDQLPFPIQVRAAEYPPEELVRRSREMFHQYLQSLGEPEEKPHAPTDTEKSPPPDVSPSREREENSADLPPSEEDEVELDFTSLWSTPLDPRAPVFIEPIEGEGELPQFNLWVFQRNVERELHTKNPQKLETELIYILTFSLEELLDFSEE